MIQIKKGYLQAFLAYFSWGLFPIFYKWLAIIPPLEVLAQRVIWSFFFCVLALLGRKQIKAFFQFFKNSNQKLLYLASSFCIGLNWYIYVYAITNNQILQGSLGYFINPIFNVLLGVLIYKEKLTLTDKIAICLITIGVLVQSMGLEGFPYIALSLAATFSIYGLLRKKMQAGSLMSMTMETSILLPLCLIYTYLIISHDTAVVPDISSTLKFGVFISGSITLVPLLLFSAAAKVLPLSHLGFIQVLSPSIQFISGYFIYNEPLGPMKLASFIIIWIACAIFLSGKLRRKGRAISANIH